MKNIFKESIIGNKKDAQERVSSAVSGFKTKKKDKKKNPYQEAANRMAFKDEVRG